ncbi:MAG: PHP domain-containing protein [Candidatus Bathyarchaeia archaeon]
MIRIDLHVHTIYSGDSTIHPKFLVDQLYAHPFIKGIAITDHDTLNGYVQVKKFAKPYEDIIVVPGIEVTTLHGHITVLGVEETAPHVNTIEGVVDFAKKHDGLVVVPHPYRVMGIGDLAKRINIDVVEALNPRSTHLENKLAEELAHAKNVPCVAGTDAHHSQDLWRVFNEVDANLDQNEVLESIKKGKVRIVST